MGKPEQETEPLILIIDDEEAVRESFADYLVDREYRVVLAENGAIGLELLKKEQPDLVLLDLQMPGMNGLDVLQAMEKLEAEIPRIVVSGTGEISDVVQALRFGAWDYILKPVIDLNVLIHAIRKGLERARLLRENKQYQEHLEELVRQRTEELESVNLHLRHINSRLQQVAGTMRDLSVYTDVNNFGKKLMEKFANHMLARGGSLYLNEEGGLRLLYSLDNDNAAPFIPFPVPADSVFEWILNNKEPIFISDINNTDFLNPSGWDGYQGDSFLGFPLQDKEYNIIGIITIHSCVNGFFIEEDKKIGAILASNSCATLRAIHAFELLKESEERFRLFFNNSSVGMFILNNEMHVIGVNPILSRQLGIEAGYQPGHDLRKVFPGIGDMILEPVATVIENGEPVFNFEGVFENRSGKTVSWLASFFPLQFKVGKPEYIAGVVIDITERKRAEDEVAAALSEKEVLIRELYHRTKNNMQIMSSLVDIQETFIEKEEYKGFFRDIRNRIRTMALVHKKLYQSNDLSTLFLNDYLKDLVDMLKSGQNVFSGTVSFRFDLDEIKALIDVTTPFGLIVNELISNIYKHAFPGNRSGEVDILLRDEGKTIFLNIRDNGVGFPRDYNPESASTMGLQTVYLLARQQLNGEVSWENSGGVSFSFRLHNDLYKVRV